MTAWDVEQGFDLDRFLSRPLVARVATAGPTVRPVWYLWEERAFWWLTGGWSRLADIIERDPGVALVVDTCELRTGEVQQVIARGTAEQLPFDADRARRWGQRYLGPDERSWGRFQTGVFEDPTTRFVRLAPTTLRARDLSFDRPDPDEPDTAGADAAFDSAT
jgi:nitroimidazol reductase NimA-like FMN-containing flavoprotein (pyridoxamine 5'-phosphate oxidase superfamily)